MEKTVKLNIKKYFYFLLTHRRNFIPILSIYFLTLPDTTANQIGLYSGIGFLASFLFQIPSGYFADNFGHKKILVISKFLMFFSTLLYIMGGYFGNAFEFFIIASIFFSLGFAFVQGTGTAFMHETLLELGKDKQFSKIMGRLKGKVSLVSIILIILLPFTTKISIYFPLYIGLLLDLIGIFIVFSLVEPNTNKYLIEDKKKKSITRILKDYKKINLLPFSVFTGSITGFLIADASFRTVYLEDLGYPIVLIGLVMGVSRLVWFIVGHYAHYIEEYLTMKQHLILDMLIFVSYYFIIVLLENYYVIGLVFSIIIGYQWGRNSVIQNYLLTNYKIDKNYKASILSIHGQVSQIFQIIGSFFIGYIMTISLKLGFFVFGVILFIILLISLFFIFRDKKLVN